MTTFPDPAALYPDVAAAGSLAAMLSRVAAEHGLDLGTAVPNERRPLLYASVPSAVPDRDALTVHAGHIDRLWHVTGWGEGIPLLGGGTTTDLVAVARAAAAWRIGTRVRGIREVAPFVTVSRRAEAAEQGPAAVVDEQWRSLLNDRDTRDWPQHVALWEAAHAEPRLRQVYPYTSHYVLRFSTTTGFPFSPDLVCLDAPRGERSFTVQRHWSGPVVAEVATAVEAVALAVELLPADLGPAVAGSYRE